MQQGCGQRVGDCRPVFPTRIVAPRTPSSRVRAAVACMVAAVAGCASSPPDFKGEWRPVNGYAAETTPIPLHHAHVFAPSPLDGTLRTMLERWAGDSKMRLSYLVPSDFTLHQGVEGIRSSDLASAAAQLSRAYAPQRVAVTVEDNGIVVRALPPAHEPDVKGVGQDAAAPRGSAGIGADAR